MTTTKSLTATASGPVALTVSGGAITIEATADPSITNAEITITTSDAEGPSADAVRGADIQEHGTRISLRLPESAGSLSVNNFSGGAIAFGGGTVVVGGSVIGGNVIQVGGVRGSIRINNGEISVPGGSAVVIPTPSRIIVTVRVPAGSSANLHTVDGRIEASGGDWASVDADTMSGSIHVGTAHSVHAKTMSGSIHVEHVTGRATLNTMSGSVTVFGADDVPVNASTMSGSVTYGRNLDATTRSMSGTCRSVKPVNQ